MPVTLEFDPTSEDSANSPLEIWATAPYAVTKFEAPAPPIAVQWASSVDTEGALPSSRKHENRTISITVEVTSAAGLRSLQAKAAKIAREGGTAKLTLPASSEVVIFDLLATDSFAPQLDIAYFANSGTFCVVGWEMTAKPYGRGAEVDHGDNVETTLPYLLFTDTGVKGDMPGLGRLVIDDDQAQARRVVFWGLESRYYSSAATAALAYQAEACALSAGSLATGAAPTSGGGSNVVRSTTLDQAPNGFTRLCAIGTSSTAQTHIGTFRVLARVYASTGNTGAVAVRASYKPYVGALSEINNAWTWLTTNGSSTGTPIEGGWMWADLGLLSIPKARTGSQGWIGWFDAQSTVLNDDVDVDLFLLFPVDESYGESITTSHTAAIIQSSGNLSVRHDGVFTSQSGGYASEAPLEGDYLRVPPAGAEARTVRMLILADRGATSSLIAGTFQDAGRLWPSEAIDDVSARLFVTPRYLVVPEP